MAKTQSDRMSTLVKDVEARAKKLRAEIRSTLDTAVKRLRKVAAAAAEQVEKFAHEAAKELEGNKKPARRPRVKRKAAPAGRTHRAHEAPTE